MSGWLEVLATGPLATVQDAGRPGRAHLGIPESGAADPPAFRLANRLVGNPESAAALELTMGGLEIRAHGQQTVAVSGAPAPLWVADRPAALDRAVVVPDQATVRLGSPAAGLRSYLAVRGGLAVEEIVGSASVDLLSGLGEPVAEGERLPVGSTRPLDPIPGIDHAPRRIPPLGPVTVHAVAGPRADWFTDEALRLLTTTDWVVDSRSNRIGLRFTGPPLERAITDELASEGTVAGSIQVPANGLPVLFLADHPVTGGYPVIAVVTAADLPLAAQIRPGQPVRVRLSSGPTW